MVWAEKFSMSVGSALFIVKNYMSSHEHGSPAETKPDRTICKQGVKMGCILLDHRLFSKATRTTNINLIGLAETGIEYIPVS